MKNLFCMIALAAIALTAWSQTPLRLSTYNGTSLERYAGKQCDVTVERYLFTGWNTISLPVDVTEQELDEVLGQGVKLERLVGVNQNGTEIVLNFQDSKSEGIQANVKPTSPTSSTILASQATREFALALRLRRKSLWLL